MSHDLKVTLLGTSSGIPTLHRNVSCSVLSVEKQLWLVDCGDGTQIQFLRKGLPFKRIHKIFITHLHGDHFYGLPGLLGMLSMMKVEQEIQVFGPKGIKEVLQVIFNASQFYHGYPLQIVELQGEQNIVLSENWVVHVRPLTHRVPCFGFVFIEIIPGRFDSRLATDLGVPKSELAKLSTGEPYRFPDGSRVVNREDCLNDPITARKVTVLGDTSDSTAIVESAVGCDVLIHEATFDGSMREVAIKSGHSTTVMAAAFAKLVNTKKLIITHFSARYDSTDELLKETQAECPDIEVIAATDFMEIIIPPHKTNIKKK